MISSPYLQTTNRSAADSRFADLVAMLMQELQTGGALDLAALAHQFPEYADRFREVLPAMEALAALPRAGGDSTFERNDESPCRKLGDFRILREIGRGGMGIVYEAEQISLGRRVALKVLPFAGMLDERALKRFKNEASAAASLDHPHIVDVYGVGSDRGVHYYAMRLIEGQSLAELTAQLRATIFEVKNESQADSSVETAAGDGQTAIRLCVSLPPLHSDDYYRAVAELGRQAAEALHHAHEQGVVHRDIKPGNLLLDARCQLWVTDFGLAHIEAGASMTAAGDVLGTLRYMSPEQAQGASAVADHRSDIYSLGVTLYELLALAPAFGDADRRELLRRIVHEEPRPLRDHDPRIPRELETAVLKCVEKDAAQRYLTAELLAEDLRRFLRHEPILAKPTSWRRRAVRFSRRHKPLLAAAACVLLVGVIGLAASSAFIWREQGRTKAALKLAQNNNKAAEAQRRRAEKLTDEVREYLYSSDMKLAFQAWNSADLFQVRSLLERHRPTAGERDLRGFEWRYLWRLSHGERKLLLGHSGEVYCVCFSRDGRQIATASQDGAIKLWDSTTGQARLTLTGHAGDVNHVTFSPDGKLLASCGDDQTVRLWDAEAGSELATLGGFAGAVSEVVFSPDGQMLATGGEDALIRLWDVAGREQIVALSGHTRRVRALAFSPDGQLLASGSSDQTVRLWDVAARRQQAERRGHTNIVSSVAFSPDGQSVASASWDQSIKIWDVHAAGELANLTGHLGRVQSVRFSSKNDVLVSAGMDGTVRLWDTTGAQRRRIVKGHGGRVWSAEFSPDGMTVATAGADAIVRLWDSDSIQGPISLPRLQGVRSIAFFPRGQTLALAANDVFLLDAPDGRQRESHRIEATDSSRAFAIAISRDGERWAAGSRDGWLGVWDKASNTALAGVQAHDGAVLALSFSANGRFLSSAGQDGCCRVWNAATLAIENELSPRPGAVTTVAFSPDGKTLATGGAGPAVHLWDVGNWRLRRALKGHEFAVRSLAFSSDGRTLASGGADRRVKIWDMVSGRDKATLIGHSAEVRCVAMRSRTALSITPGRSTERP